MPFGQWHFIEPRRFEGFATILYFFQVLLTNLCQDPSLDIVLRLQLLEVCYAYMGCNADIIVKLMH